MRETLKLMKRYALAALLLLCLTGAVCGAAMVDENSRRLSVGEKGAQVGFQSDRKTVALFREAEEPAILAVLPPPQFLEVLRCSPAPVGSIAALGQSLYEVIAGIGENA
ncbi:MAG: hypothetical protein LBC83_03415 [Oscillospiraceae bacterium]|jgi:hypothetical protein|nr:hypothetical protein [Oscillospiraceae bacterium]